ncbi:MAG: DMT family transporter [Candidatus Bathyarchaeia archaeon]
MTWDLEKKGTLAVIISTIILGLNIFVIKIGEFYVPQLPLTSIALTVAGLILLILNTSLRKEVDVFLETGYSLKFLWIGIVGTAIPFAMVIYGVNVSMVSNSFLLQVEVIFSMIFSHVLLKEKITKQQALLTVFTFLGVALVVTDGIILSISMGDILFLLAPVCFQAAHVVAKGVMKEVDSMVVTAYRLLIGGLTLIGISVLAGWNLLEFSKTYEGTILMLYVIFASFIVNGLWYYGVKHINLSKATSINIIYPLISTILAILLLGEKLSYIKILGISLVFLCTLGLSRVKSVSRK